MSDEMLDFIEDHRKWIILGVVAVILVIAMFGVRSVNAKRKAAEAEAQQIAEAEAAAEAERLAALEQDEEEVVQPVEQYKNSLGLDADNEEDERVVVKEPEPPKPEVREEVKRAKYPPSVIVFDNTAVPVKNVDGSSCKDYLSGVALADFDTLWGSSLTEDDFNSETRYLVGVEQNPDDFNRGDLQSVGWLIQHLGELNASDCVKFTNLHVIGSLSSSHVALLCSYDWYSAFGLKETLVVFEDISGTLKTSDFNDGDVFSASVYVHNMKTEDVNGQTVVCVEYDVFDE